MENETLVEVNEALANAREIARNQRAAFKEKANGWVKRMDRQFKEKFGYSAVEEYKKYGFSLAACAKQLRERGLREDITSSQLFALTTGLVTYNLANEYQTVPTVYRDVANIKPSTKSEESYFALQRADVPTPLEDNESAPSSSLGGVLTRIKNYRFARVIEFSSTLEEDDQTGQISDEAIGLGKKMAYAEELWWATQLIKAYVAANIRTSAGIIPDMCIAGQEGNDPNYGGPTLTAAAVSRDGIANLWTAADYITDIAGDFALVDVNVGVFANSDKVTVNTILASAFNPNTISASANVTPGVYAENPLKDIVKSRFTRFFKYFAGTTKGALAAGNPWFLGEAGCIGSFQDRTALSVTMESPLAGKSWEANMRRTKAERRFGAGVTLPEKALRGN